MFEDDLDDFEEPMMDGSDDDFSVILGEDNRDHDFSDQKVDNDDF